MGMLFVLIGVNSNFMYASESKQENAAYKKYEGDIRNLIKQAEGQLKKDKNAAYRSYADAKRVIHEELGGVSFDHKEALKKLVLTSINKLPSGNAAIKGLAVWFEPTTEEELNEFGNMNLEDIFQFQDVQK